MTILTIETSTVNGGLAIFRDSEIIYEKKWSQVGSHSEALTPAIREGLLQTQMDLEQIDFIGVDIGPGSFTGIRVGINAARTLGFVFRTPLFGFSSLLVMAEVLGLKDRPILSLVDAQRNQFYCGVYQWVSNRWEFIVEPKIIVSPDQILEIPVSSFYLCAESNLISSSFLNQIQDRGGTYYPVRPTSVGLATLVQMFASHTKPLVWNELAPLYLRYSAAEESLKS